MKAEEREQGNGCYGFHWWISLRPEGCIFESVHPRSRLRLLDEVLSSARRFE